MNDLVYDYVRQVIGQLEVFPPVIEIGALNINGSIRNLFPQDGYIGVDMQPGDGVDIQAKANVLPFDSHSFNTVVSCEMLEHDDRPWESIREFNRVLKKDGLLILTTRGIGFHKHGYPSDYWRFTAEGLATLMNYGRFRVLDVRESQQDCGVLGVGQVVK